MNFAGPAQTFLTKLDAHWTIQDRFFPGIVRDYKQLISARKNVHGVRTCVALAL